MNHQTIAVLSGNHHTVKPWFAGRVDVSPPVVDFGAQGFALAGGRVDRIAGAPAAVVVYHHGAHEIDLFVWADRKPALPREAVRNGYRTMFWKAGDLDFAAVSDVERSELEKFVQLVRGEEE
jgi:anti-sigma factor RsiW